MRIGSLVLRLRAANTHFGEYIGGTVELSQAQKGTLGNKDMAFVIPLEEEADPSQSSGSISQPVYERFGVIVVMRNDISHYDKLSITAYDRLHDIRSEIFRAVMGINIQEAESVIYFRGGRLLDITPAYLWYQYEFEYKSRLLSGATVSGVDSPGDGVVDLQTTAWSERQQVSQLGSFDTLYTQWSLSPSVKNEDALKEAIQGGLTVSTDLIDMESLVDLTDNPDAGAYSKGFGSGFDKIKS